MPAPILAVAAASAAGSIIGSVTSAIVSPAARPVTYLANEAIPSLLPGPDEYLRLYHSGYIGLGTLANCLHKHAIGITEANPLSPAPQQWRAIVNLARSKPNDSTVVNLWLANVISRSEADARLKELGYSVKRERDLLLAEKTRFELSTILHLYHTGWLDFANAKTALRNIGYTKEDDQESILKPENPLNGGDVIQLYLRGLLSDAETDAHFERMGYRLDQDRRLIVSLSNAIPPITDIVRFVKRDAFDEELVQQFGLDDEYDLQKDRYEFWAGTQGLGEMTLPGSPNGEIINWPKMYYRADWQYISPTQGYEALHRFRPERVHLYRDVAPGIRPFNVADMRAILKAADYPKSMRDWLVGSSYNLPTLTDINNFYASGALGSLVIDQPCDPGNIAANAQCSPARREAYELYQDRGYKPIDAARLTVNLANRHTQKTRRAVFGVSRAVISDGYRTGILSWEEAAVRLYRLRFESAEQRAAFDALDYGEKVALARQDADTMQVLAHLDFQADLQLVKEQIRYIRSGYFSGRWDRTETQTQLARLGINATKIDRYLATWDAKRTGSRKMLTVTQLVKYARYGLLGGNELTRRLRTFGYDDISINAILGGLQRDVGLDAARQAERSAKTEQQRRRAIEQQVRQLQREQQQAEKRLTRLGTAAQLSAWVERGIIAPERMLRRLIATGVSEEDATAKTEEAVQRRNERLARLTRG